MPLMSPNIQSLMRAAGLEQVKEGNNENSLSISDKLDAAGLDLETVLQNLSSMANNSANEALRMKANETALKMHGALKETAAVGPQMPSFVLNIINGEQSESVNIPVGVNPIFLPRQLHSQIEKEKQTAN